jgi:hypothetical protein
MRLSRLLRVLAAYLVVLHAVGMGAMAAPVAASAATFGVICTLDGHASNTGDPAHPSSHQVPCALCGFGSCAAAVPPESGLPGPQSRVPADRAHLLERGAVNAPTCAIAQPRGPPAAV